MSWGDAAVFAMSGGSDNFDKAAASIDFVLEALEEEPFCIHEERTILSLPDEEGELTEEQVEALKLAGEGAILFTIPKHIDTWAAERREALLKAKEQLFDICRLCTDTLAKLS